jgi:hypothetical protein
VQCVQLCLDLPGCQIRPQTRVRILFPHREAGKTGRINMRFGSDYLVNLRGKITSCHRWELEIIDKRRGFRQGNHTYPSRWQKYTY